MKKLFVLLVIISVCLGAAAGYVSSKGPRKVWEDLNMILSGSQGTGENESQLERYEKDDYSSLVFTIQRPQSD